MKTLFLFSLGCIALSFLSGCTTIKPQAFVPSQPVESFDYSTYAGILDQAVDEEGKVDYALLKKNPAALNQFYAQLAAFSPDSHPSLFPEEEDRLAYWINAYNATVIKTVLEYYPIDGVGAVKGSFLSTFLPDKSGFFLLQRLTYGGATTSLYYIENNVIRKRFSEPQIHFALNCASISCPELSKTPFLPESLKEQLHQVTKAFINDDRHVHIDLETKTLHLSSIFQWYEDDFIEWLKLHHPEKPATLTEYIKGYLSPERLAALQQIEAEASVSYLPYDWSLNDSK